MNQYSNIKKAIDWAEKYENQLIDGAQWDDKKFSIWLCDELKTTKENDAVLLENAKPSLTMYVYFMYKYALFYSRKIFKKSMIYSIDDFSVLASLLPDKHLTKAEVIRKNISEKSSGNEVLKRLLRQKLIIETKNPNDNRSKLLQISAAGINEITAILGQLQKMGDLVEGNLDKNQKILLINMLSRLNDFHRPIFNSNDEDFLNEKLGITVVEN